MTDQNFMIANDANVSDTLRFMAGGLHKPSPPRPVWYQWITAPYFKDILNP